MELDDIILKYNKKEITITLINDIKFTGILNGYETKSDSEVGDDVIFLDMPNNSFSEVKLSDIKEIELSTQ